MCAGLETLARASQQHGSEPLMPDLQRWCAVPEPWLKLSHRGGAKRAWPAWRTTPSKRSNGWI